MEKDKMAVTRCGCRNPGRCRMIGELEVCPYHPSLRDQGDADSCEVENVRTFSYIPTL